MAKTSHSNCPSCRTRAFETAGSCQPTQLHGTQLHGTSAMFQQRSQLMSLSAHLDGFAQAHLISYNASSPLVVQLPQPLHPCALVPKQGRP